MQRINEFAGIVDSDLRKFPGRSAEITSAFKVYIEGGWGKGFSGEHLKKIIARDETTFTTTWAELRRDQMLYSQKRLIAFQSVGVPLPCGKDGKTLTDREIRKMVNEGHRLMFCPITNPNNLEKSPIFYDLPWNPDWKKEIIDNGLPTKPYWFWITCHEGGSTIYDEFIAERSPTLLEYLISTTLLKEELGRPLDIDCRTWLDHTVDKKELVRESDVVLGGNPTCRFTRSRIINNCLTCREHDDKKTPIVLRFVERL